MTDNTVILRGNVLFDSVSLTGDIQIEFNKDKDDNIQSKVYYKHKGSPYKYILLPDNRTVAKWNKFLSVLVDSLTNRVEGGA